jgi:ketosteroid isomerase-like protein
MRRAILLGIITLLASSPVQAQGPSSAERELVRLENDWSTALQKRDTAFLQKLFADEFLSTDATGAAFNKAQEIANWTTEGARLDSFLLSDLKVHVYGDTAVVTGVNTMKGTYRGQDFGGAFRFTDVFVKRGGRWQAVATQATLVAKK